MKILSTKDIALIGSIAIMAGLTSNARTVQEAYELRLDGNADAALALLERAVATEPDNAEAWYELARTKAHIGLGKPRSMMEMLKESQAAAEKAAKLEPDNLIYAIYKAKSCGTGAYIALQQQAPDAKHKIQEYISSYEYVLELKPDYHEARLSLVEYLKMLPPEKGGDPAKAEKYTKELEKADAVLGAQAREMMLPEDTDLVAFWQKVLEDNPGNADVLERLGKAYLYEDKDEQGIQYIKQAIRLNPEKNILHLDIARYYMYQAMRDMNKLETLAPKMDEAYMAYIVSKPKPIPSMLAYAKGSLGRIKSHTGDKELANKLGNEAKLLDPSFSKATGIPDQNLFIPPEQIPHGFVYFTRPF
jgi:tetratricopeptide (TPR) repeat protein